MLTKPNIHDNALNAHLETHYSLTGARVEFLPLGADSHSAVYKVIVQEKQYLLKLRNRDFDDVSVRLPAFLKQHGGVMVLAALPTLDRRLSSTLHGYHLHLYPFIEGRNGFEAPLTVKQWIKFGMAVRHYQQVKLSADLQAALPVEAYSPRWRESVRAFMTKETKQKHTDPIAAELADIMQAQRAQIENLVNRTERLAERMKKQPPELVLCHADIHGGNLLAAPDGELYIIDWDAPLLAPKERDLMFIGGGVGGVWNKLEEEEAFYRGYFKSPGNDSRADEGRFSGYANDPGSELAAGYRDHFAEVDTVGLAYYRSERIVEDLALYAQVIFHSQDNEQDRRLSLHYFESNFEPDGVLEIANETYERGYGIGNNVSG